MAASVAIHAFVFSLGVKPAAVTNGRAETPATSPASPSGIRIERIVVVEPAAQPELAETAIEEAVPEPTEPDAGDPAPTLESTPDDPAPTPQAESEDPSPTLEPEPGDPSPTLEPEPGDPSPALDPEAPRAAGTAAAARLRARFTNPVLWRKMPDGLADSAFTRVSPLSGRVDGTKRGYTPTDAWAFATWTTRDAGGRLWGATPGFIYLGGIAMPTCNGRFDASNCGFGAPSWRLGQYQRFLHALREIEEQKRWGRIMERGQAIRERPSAERDTVPGILDG